MYSCNEQSCDIKTWQKFAKNVRVEGCNLLRRLDDFPDSILVAGCQRSGTTMLSRLLTESEGMVNYWFGPDDELDAALILSGYVAHEPKGRYCFQTTYVNECFSEYFDRTNGHKLIWVLRNPHSVVFSLLHNWKRFALNELFRGCGTHLLNFKDKQRYDLLGRWGLSRAKRACLAYNGKVSQVFELKQRLDNSRMMVIDYDELVREKETMLPAIYEFAGLPFKREYCEKIHSKSIKKADRLSNAERSLVNELCIPVYQGASALLSNLEK